MSGQTNSKKDSAKSRILLDTKPLIKLFAREDGWEEIRIILSKIEKVKIQGAISVLSLTEIYYKYLRESGPDLAEERVKSLRFADYLQKLPIDEQIATKAGEFKGKYSVSVVDAIIAATAWNSRSLIVSDDLDFKKIKEIETLTEKQYVSYLND
jgi:predicted nucleic acid-binding protein